MTITSDSNIRAFPGIEVPEQTLSTARESYRFCNHDKITLNEHSRTVCCAACGKVFDPFNFLQKEVTRLQVAWEDHKHVRSSLNDLNDRVDALKKEEVRLRARIKTARAKVEPAIDVRNRQL